ncbi:hypothetical protein TNCT_515871 [Trichonephila clavata]|uniref:Uncharacterized protein n=1 Tax=Trichonephila clavata TaxID=2740835 RepID=A0A8X6IEI3_TRICU|nr:hypothetical protein TNCT_515871 [Trichonephila clavata]
MLVDGPNASADMSSDSTVTTVAQQSQDDPVEITEFFFLNSLKIPFDEENQNPVDEQNLINELMNRNNGVELSVIYLDPILCKLESSRFTSKSAFTPLNSILIVTLHDHYYN